MKQKKKKTGITVRVFLKEYFDLEIDANLRISIAIELPIQGFEYLWFCCYILQNHCDTKNGRGSSKIPKGKQLSSEAWNFHGISMW